MEHINFLTAKPAKNAKVLLSRQEKRLGAFF